MDGFLERKYRDPVVTEERMLSRQFRPRSVRAAASGVVQEFSETLISDGVVVGNGQYATHAVTTEANSGEILVQEVEWAVFVSTDDDFQLSECLMPYLPSISSPSLADYDITGPFKSVVESITDATNGNTMPKGASSERIVVRNISAGSVTMWFVNQVKYIVNGGSA